MRPFRLAVLWTLILSSQALSGPGRPEPINEDLQCRQVDSAVVLEWNIQFLIPIDSFVVSRDGEVLAKLPPEAMSYLDQSVTPGPHVYHLSAIQSEPVGSENNAGQRIELGSCSIDVVGTRGLRCKAEENTVRLEWGQILVDIPILGFVISRNGETIAIVPPEQLIYDDVVFSTGTHDYAVHATTSSESEFLVGSCNVNVACFGIQTDVSGLEVRLTWDGLPGPLGSPIAPVFTVTRDNEVIVKTERMEPGPPRQREHDERREHRALPRRPPPVVESRQVREALHFS